MNPTTIRSLVLATGLVLAGAALADPGAIAKTDAEQIVRAAVVAKYPGVLVKQIVSSKGGGGAAAVRNHRYSFVVVDGKTQLRGTVVIDLRAWSPRAGIDRVSEIKLAQGKTGAELASLEDAAR